MRNIITSRRSCCQWTATAWLLVATTATALASDGPRRAADRLLSAEQGLTIDEVRQLVAQVERDEPTSELAHTVRGLSELSLAHCNEHFYRDLIEKRGRHLDHLPLVRYLTDVMRRQRKWCQNYLDTELLRRVGQFSSQTQHYLELFMRGDLVGRDFYRRPDDSIRKLRQFTEEAAIETSEAFEAHFGAPFFGACREINGLLDKLEAIRRQQEIFASLPRTSDRYFRVNSFCKNLVDFDLLDAINEILFAEMKSRNTLIKFGRYLRPEDEINFQIASDAALEYATDFEIALSKRPNSHKRQPLSKRQQQTVKVVLRELQAACSTALEPLANLIWLLQFARLQPEQLAVGSSESHKIRLHKYLRTVNACQQLSALDVERLLHGHQQHLLETRRRQSSIIRRALAIFNRP